MTHLTLIQFEANLAFLVDMILDKNVDEFSLFTCSYFLHTLKRS